MTNLRINAKCIHCWSWSANWYETCIYSCTITLKIGRGQLQCTLVLQCYYSNAHHFTQDRRTSHYRGAVPVQGFMVCGLQNDKIFKAIGANLSEPHLVELLGPNKCLYVWTIRCAENHLQLLFLCIFASQDVNSKMSWRHTNHEQATSSMVLLFILLPDSQFLCWSRSVRRLAHVKNTSASSWCKLYHVPCVLQST